ncbi:MAG: VWA domain-containing protein [bacterium]|nr:VWA domain-containing protein [bacterium]
MVEKKIIPPGAPGASGLSKSVKPPPGSPESYNSVTVEGTVRFTDIDGGTHPVRFAVVQIWDAEDGFVDELVATTATNNDGYYTVTFDDNDGDGTGRDVYVVVRAAGDTVSCEGLLWGDRPGFGVWEIDSGDPLPDVIDDSTLLIDITATNDDASYQNVIFEAYEAFNTISRYMMTLGEPMPPLLTIAFPRTDSDSSGVDPVEPWCILSATDVHDWDTMHHEYAHHMQKVYDLMDHPVLPHITCWDMCDIFGKDPATRMAWAESWATFFAIMAQQEMNLAALGIPNLGDTRYTDTRPIGDDVDYDLEDIAVCGTPGEGDEYSVMCVLWDLYDDADDGGDAGVSLTAGEMWQAARDNHPYTFSAFWNGLTFGRTEAEKIAYGAICTQYSIAPRITGPADGTTYSGGPVPTFQWESNLACDTGGNGRFSLRFYNDALTTLIWASPWQSGLTFSPSDTQQNTIFIGPPGTLRWVVAGKDLTVPETGVYYSAPGTIVDDFDAPDRNPVDIILVLDISGSMRAVVPGSGTDLTKIELLRQAVEIFVNTWAVHAVDGDRMGIVYFNAHTATLVDVPPFLKDVAVSAGDITDDVRARLAGGCTAMGGGLQVAYDNFDDADPDKKRVIILFSDGEQTANPLMVEDGLPARLKIETIPVSDAVPFGGYWCSSAPADSPDGSPVVPDGDFLYQHDLEIHTIGVGAEGADFRGLIQRIADETTAFHHFTAAPDEDLDIFFTNDLINSLKTGTLEIVKVDRGSIRGGESKNLSVPVNHTAESLTLVLSWKGDRAALKKDALRLEVQLPFGGAATPATVKKGEFYTILHFPFAEEKTNGFWGNWGIRIVGGTDVSSLRYQFSAIVDEPCFDYLIDFPRRMYTTGERVPLTVTLTQEGKPLPSSAGVWVEVTSPMRPVGNLLAGCLPGFRSRDNVKRGKNQSGERPPTQYEKLLAAFMDNPDNAALVKAKRTARLGLYDDGSAQHGDAKAGDGIYSTLLAGTRIPGTYEIRFQITGSSLCGRVMRTESTSILVGLDFSAAHSELKAVAVNDGLYDIVIKPGDRFGNLLGPGRPHSVQILSTGGTLVDGVADRLNGSYSQRIKMKPGKNPLIVVMVNGKQLYNVRLSPMLGLPFVEPGL